MSALSSQFNGAAVAEEAAVTDVAAVVLGPLDLQAYDRWALYVENIAGGDDLDSLTIETAPTTDGPWVVLYTEATFVPLAAGEAGVAQLASQAVKFLRVKAACAAGETTTLNLWLSVGGLE